jgi:hypothetical protein
VPGQVTSHLMIGVNPSLVWGRRVRYIQGVVAAGQDRGDVMWVARPIRSCY